MLLTQWAVRLVPLLLSASPAAKEAINPLAVVAPLVGHWTAEADPRAPGVTGWSSFEWEAQGHVLVRKNHADYPASKDKPASVHDDLMVVYAEGSQMRAEYFDNEGHIIRYAVTSNASTLVFVSDVQPSAPRFRLTYSWAEKGKLDLTFEIAPPGAGDQFKPYIQAHLRKD